MENIFWTQLSFHKSEELEIYEFFSRTVRVIHGAKDTLAEAGKPVSVASGFVVKNCCMYLCSASKESLENLLDNVEKTRFFKDYVIVERIRTKCSSDVKNWVEFRRLRIPSGKTAKGREDLQSKNMDRRNRVIEKFRAKQLLVLKQVSASSGHKFLLSIEQLKGSKPEKMEPDTWGLSTSSRSFAIPSYKDLIG